MRVLLVVDPATDQATFVRDVAAAATTGLCRSGNDVDEIDLVATRFPPVMTSADRRAYFTAEPLVCPAAAASAELVRAADALVFVYPTTLSTVTVGVKGWIERTFVPGVAFTIGDTLGTARGLSNIRRLVGISLYDESHWDVVRRGDNGRRLIRRNIRLCGGLGTSSRWLAMYDCARADDQRRTAFLARVERRMAAL
jgi:putative NADPH-quinone reductase